MGKVIPCYILNNHFGLSLCVYDDTSSFFSVNMMRFYFHFGLLLFLLHHHWSIIINQNKQLISSQILMFSKKNYLVTILIYGGISRESMEPIGVPSIRNTYLSFIFSAPN